jgi:hypothetical protein
MRAKDLTGQKFGRWYVVRFSHFDERHNYFWLCHCECGNSRPVYGNSLIRGWSKSCGCLMKEKLASDNTTHGESRSRNHAGSKEYNAWRSIISRCENPGCTHYKRYGGRGIKMYPEWRKDFSVFLAYVGRAPAKEYQMERINNDGNYEPGNVCWVNAKTQCNNRHNSQRTQLNLSSGFLSFGA